MFWSLVAYFCQRSLIFTNHHSWALSWPELAGFLPVDMSVLFPFLESLVHFLLLGIGFSGVSPGPILPLPPAGDREFGYSSIHIGRCNCGSIKTTSIDPTGWNTFKYWSKRNGTPNKTNQHLQHSSQKDLKNRSRKMHCQQPPYHTTGIGKHINRAGYRSHLSSTTPTPANATQQTTIQTN